MVVLYIFGGLLSLVVLYVLFLWVCSLPIDLEKEYTSHSPFYRFLLYSFTALGLWVLRVRVRVTGMEQVPRHKKVVFVSNHLSNYDPIVTWHIFRKWNIAFLSKESNFHIPVFGRFVRRCGFLAIDRENPRKAMAAIQSAAALLESGSFSVGVYPEGTRSKTGVLLPFHNGVFKIAQRGDADIVVLRIDGTQNICRNYLRRPTDVTVEVLDVLPAEEIQHQKTERIGNTVRQLLQKERT